MKKSLAFAFLTASGLVLAPMAHAEPGGCIKYGAAGAVGGHLVHHGVLGATGGCVTGMVTRHEYRKGLREKAALYDKEHPVDPNQSWLQRHHNALTYQQKAALWDHEHPTDGTTTPGASGPATTGSATNPPAPPGH